jgi:Amt family ammonium transporter
VAWILGKIIDKTMGFRISEDDEVAGIDIAVHAESAYDLSPGHSGIGTLASITAPAPAPAAADAPTKVEADA